MTLKRLSELSAPILDIHDNKVRDPENPTNNLTARSALGSSIARAQSQDPVRMMRIAHELMHSKTHLDLDDKDIEALKGIVLADKSYTNTVKGPVIQILESAKDAPKKKE